MSTAPDSKRASACSRWRCDLLPCIATALTPCAASRLTSRSAPRLVRTNTSVRSRSRRSSRTSASTRCSCATCDEPVLDLGAGAPCRRSVLVDRGIVRVALGDASGLAVEGGGEEQRLARLRARGDDPVDRGPKAHVEHPVGLVEDQHPDVLERERAACEQILEPAGRRDQHVRRGGVLGLLDQADAAVDRRDAQRAGVRDLADVIDDLRRELAGRREHERRRTPVLGAIRSTSGIPNASVLPEPVGDFAITSRPAIASPITARWIANGSVIPAAERELITARDTPRSANDSVDMHNSLAAHDGPRTIREAMADPNRCRAEPKQAASRPTTPTAHSNVAGRLTASRQRCCAPRPPVRPAPRSRRRPRDWREPSRRASSRPRRQGSARCPT